MDAISAARSGLFPSVQRVDGASLANAFAHPDQNATPAAALAELKAKTSLNTQLAVTRAANRPSRPSVDIIV